MGNLHERVPTPPGVRSYWPTIDELIEAGPAAPRAVRALEGTETIQLVEDQAGYPETVHMLLSDVIMPKLSGPTLAQRIVQRRPAIKVVVAPPAAEAHTAQHDAPQSP